MDVKLLSDLHIDVAKYKIKKTEKTLNTTLVLAGDIANGRYARNYIEDLASKFKYIVFIIGNHEFYGNEYFSTIQYWRDFADTIDNVYFLEKDTIILDGVRFVGGTLWTDMSVVKDPLDLWSITRRMSDFSIKFNENNLPYPPKTKVNSIPRLTPENMTKVHKETLDYFAKVLQNKHEGKTVVVTHHSPLFDFCLPKFKGSQLNPCFHSDLSEFIMNHDIDYWFFGHTHHCHWINRYGTTFISNQRGYSGYEDPYEIGFNDEINIEIN